MYPKTKIFVIRWKYLPHYVDMVPAEVGNILLGCFVHMVALRSKVVVVSEERRNFADKY